MKHQIIVLSTLILIIQFADACSSGKSDSTEPVKTDNALLPKDNAEDTKADKALPDIAKPGNAPVNVEIPSENANAELTTKEVIPDDLKENIPGTAWQPTPEQIVAFRKDYPDYHVFEDLSCYNPYCNDDDDEEDEDNDETEDSVKDNSPKEPKTILQDPEANKAADERSKWEAAYEHASDVFCAQLDLPEHVDCKVKEGKLYIHCGMDMNKFFGSEPYSLNVHEDTKNIKVEYHWQSYHQSRYDNHPEPLGDLNRKLKQVECVAGENSKHWKCINPEGCGTGGLQCKGFEYINKKNDEYFGKCDCPYSEYREEEQPDKTFICRLDQNESLRWFCNNQEGCDYYGERIPYGKPLSCYESNSEFIYGHCYCNGKKRSFADETPCEPLQDAEGKKITIHAVDIPYLKELDVGQTCHRLNGCMCGDKTCPQSGFCSLMGCVDAITGTVFMHSDGYWVSGIFKQCDEIKGCSCGEHSCPYGDVCLNNWFCSHTIQTVIHDGKRYLYEDGNRYRDKFAGFVGDYEYEACEDKIMKDFSSEYACMYAFDVSACVDGCFGGLDEVDYHGFPIARCASSEGCACGNTVCPEYARCISGACYYDNMYEVIMCGHYKDPRQTVSNIVNAYARIALEPAENVDISGKCLVDGLIRPPKFNDIITDYPKEVIELMIESIRDDPETLKSLTDDEE